MRGRLTVAAASVAAVALLSGAVAGGMRVTPVETVDGFPAEPELDYSLFTGGIAPLRAEYIAGVLGRALSDGGRGVEPASAHAGEVRQTQGVTRDEVRVLVYVDTGVYSEESTPPPGTYVDADKAPLRACQASDTDTALGWSDPNVCDHSSTRMVRALSKSFNARIETHNRHVHFWLYFTDADTPEERELDAEANAAKLRPFAILDEATLLGSNLAYTRAAARLGILTFSSEYRRRVARNDYQAVAPYSWGFWPDVERAEELFRSYLCRKVGPFPVRRFGNPPGLGAPNGLARKFGIYYPREPHEPELFAERLIKGLARCGIEVVAQTYERSGYAVDARDDGTDATGAAAAFQTQGVTTVIYVGLESRLTTVFDALRYYPEIVVAGDLMNDNNAASRAQNQNVWRNAWAVTHQIRIGSSGEGPAATAFREGDPSRTQDGNGLLLATEFYPDFLMIFTAVSRAGRSLTPISVERGLRSITRRSSVSPFEAASFFASSDFTFVRDAAEQWWDPSGASPRPPSPPRSGCWRMVRGGQRSLAGEWPGGDDVFSNATDPCTGFEGFIVIRLD